MSTDIRTAAEGITDQLVAWRRHFHAHPEVGNHEEQTARFVADRLRELGFEPQERFGGGFGVVADLRVADGPMVALRADLDALPVTEETGVEYASRNPGVMHACGHDAHIAMLLGAAILLAERRDRLPQSVRLIFQPCEEAAPGGAVALVSAGVLDRVERILGLHVWSEMPLGTLGTRVGPFMAATTEMTITVHGKGGHAAMPQQCIDPIVIASEIVLALQTIVSRSISMADHGVVTIGRITGGTACNVIPASVQMRGTIRALTDTIRETAIERTRTIISHVAAAHGATADLDITNGYPALENDATCIDGVLAAAERVGISQQQLVTLPPQGGGEDFAYYARKVPAAFVFLGARPDTGEAFPHHHPRFDINEQVLPIGTALLAEFALDPRG